MKTAIGLFGVIFGIAAAGLPSPAAGQEGDRKYEGRTIEEWIARWDSGKFQESREARQALARIGKPAVPALVELIEKNDARLGRAIQTLGDMGPEARAALPLLVRIARGKPSRQEPEGWTWNVSSRELVFSALGEMEWAAEELVPLLRSIAADAGEPESVRTRATGALGGMGQAALADLRGLARAESDAVRQRAHNSLLNVLEADREEYYARVLEENPFDPNAPAYLGTAKGRYNAGRLHPPTERVKVALRESLLEERDPQRAWTLIQIIQDQLGGTSLQWAAPSDSFRYRTDRENPKESFATLAEVAEVGFRAAPRDSDLRWTLGIGLARLRLLQGDWAAMNAQLKRLGQKPIPERDRPWLPAPPTDWKDLRSTWGRASEKMRTGDCGLVIRVEKGGKGLAGVHVLVKEAPKPTRVFRSGIQADTLFLRTLPFERHLGAFGYMGRDRLETRYAVTDASGTARLEKLPEIAIKLEVLVPTGNFSEAGPGWELWMEVAPGEFKLASGAPGPRSVRNDTPPALVELEAGETVHYPLLVVRPRFGFNVHDGARVDRKFVLTWSKLPSAPEDRRWTHELELSVSGPSDHSDLPERAPVLRSRTEVVRGNQWPVGEAGVGGLRLVPGNFYIVSVVARDEGGQVMARWPRRRIWVPWEHRGSDPPVADRDHRDGVPITHNAWWRQSSTYGDGRKENLRQKVERFLRDRPRAFEREYVRMGKAWIDWRDGDREGAREQLAKLIEELPAGNVARETSRWLLDRIDSGASCPKRLKFVDGRD